MVTEAPGEQEDHREEHEPRRLTRRHDEHHDPDRATIGSSAISGVVQPHRPVVDGRSGTVETRARG